MRVVVEFHNMTCQNQQICPIFLKYSYKRLKYPLGYENILSYNYPSTQDNPRCSDTHNCTGLKLGAFIVLLSSAIIGPLELLPLKNAEAYSMGAITIKKCWETELEIKYIKAAAL